MTENTTVACLRPLLALPFSCHENHFSTGLQDNGRVVKPHPYPDGRDPSAPPVLDPPSRANPKAIEMQNRKELRANVAKLYDMVVELKDQVEKTDANSTLSIPVMKKAQQIGEISEGNQEPCKGLAFWRSNYPLVASHARHPRSDIPLHLQQSCVSLNESKRRGKFQGKTERALSAPKSVLIEQFRTHVKDTGSPEVQIALPQREDQLSDPHLKSHDERPCNRAAG